MKITLLWTLSLLLIAARCPAADDSAEKTITKTFTVQPGGEISVDADEGDIEVATADQSTVQVIVEREVTGGSESQAAAMLKAHNVTFSQNENHVSVESRRPKAPHGLFSHPHLNLSVHFKITVPRHFDVTLNTSGGDIRVADLTGTVGAGTSGGNLTFSKIQGTVEGKTSGGNVKATGCTDKLNVQTSGGNIFIKDFTGPNALADTSGGNVEVIACAGKLQVKTSGGNINIESFSGASVNADTSGGSVSFDQAKPAEGDCWLRTSGGNITAKLPATSALNLTAATDGGEVNCDLPVTVQGKIRPGKLEGQINGGGPNFLLRTSGGDINIRVRKE
jgi:Putative adhesin